MNHFIHNFINKYDNLLLVSNNNKLSSNIYNNLAIIAPYLQKGKK